MAEAWGIWEMHTLDLSRLYSSAGAHPTTKDKAAIVRFGGSKLYTGRFQVRAVASPSPRHGYAISPRCSRRLALLEEKKL